MVTVLCVVGIAISLGMIALSGGVRLFSGRPGTEAQLSGPVVILHQPVVRVPLRLDGRPFVDVMVNGQGPYKFLLDTGCGPIHVSQDVAKQLQLPQLANTVSGPVATGDTVEYQLVRIRSLRVGEAELVNLIANVHPNYGPLDEYDGIVGFSVFQQWLVTLDFPAKWITLERGPLPPPDSNEILPFVATKTPPTVPVFLNGMAMELLVDTGSGGCIGLPEVVAQTLSFRSPHFDTPGRTAGGQSRVRHARMLGRAHIGGQDVEDPIISWFPGKRGTATVGMQILQHFVLTFDSANRRVRFSRNEEGPIRVPGFRTVGLTFGITKDGTAGKAVVETVNPVTPAAHLDIRVGDEVVSADGKPFTEFTDQKWDEFVKDLSTVPFELKRGDRRFTVEVPVVERP